MSTKPTISVLVSARRNSKYLAKFLFGLKARTRNAANIEVLVMMNEHDDWNNELVQHFDGFIGPHGTAYKFYRENMQLGRAGLHEYFNELVKHSQGDWLIYFCEDHFIIADNWDVIVKQFIEARRLDADKPWCIIPKFDNVGSVNHIVSRGWVNALGGKIGRHGWIDSYLNDMREELPHLFVRMDAPLFHDFTHDVPNPMSDAHLQSGSTDKGKMLPAYDSPQTAMKLQEDIEKIKRAIAKEDHRGLQE